MWYQRICDSKKDSIVSWFIFTDELIAHYGDIKSNTFSPLLNFRQRGPITEYINQFQKLGLRVKNIPKGNLLDFFIGTSKESIQHEVCPFEPKSLENDFSLERKVESKNMDTRRASTNTYREGNVSSSNLTKSIRMMPLQEHEHKYKMRNL